MAKLVARSLKGLACACGHRPRIKEVGDKKEKRAFIWSVICSLSQLDAHPQVG